MTYIQAVKSFIIQRKWYVLGGLVGLVVIIALAMSFSGNGATATTEEELPSVKVSRVSDLMRGGSSLSAIAEITSVSEAKISPETAGKITRVRASLGDFVSAGQVLAEVENSSQRAAVLQAEGALDAAKAANVNTDVSLDSAKSTALNTILSAYATYEGTVTSDIDVLFLHPESQTPTFRVLSSESQLKTKLENEHVMLSNTLKRQNGVDDSLTVGSDLATELGKAEADLRALRSYLDTTIQVLNKAIPGNEITASDIATYLSGATSARTSVTTSLSAIASAQSSLTLAANNSGDTGVVSASSAALKQAQGAYNAALANLEKTIIRTPISGTLNNFTIKLGDTVSPQQQVAIVSNNGALEAVAYVTEEDKSQISVGKKVTLEGDVIGTITKIAPALDPVTRRIEVRIGLPSGAIKEFTNGQSVRVELANESGEATKPVTGPLAIPITALRMEASRTIVFTVEKGALVAKEITIGRLSGETVQVTAGLTADTEIVVDARGRKEGEMVNVQ